MDSILNYNFTYQGFGWGPCLIGLVVGIFFIIVWWKIFEKAGLPGWGALIPFYNTYLYVKTAQRPGWWMILLFIPIVNLVIAIVMCFDIARVFGKGNGFGFGLLFLGIIFFPILAFGKAQYQAPKPA